MADNVLPFRPRPQPAPALRPVSQQVLVPREELEDAAHAALDAADKLIALLDRIDGNPDLEPGGDDEPSLGAPEEHGNNVVWCRGTARDLELDRQPETSLVKARLTRRAALVLGLPAVARGGGRLRRRHRELLVRAEHEAGRGNVVTAAGLMVVYLAGL